MADDQTRLSGKRSAIEWTARLGLAIAATVVGYNSVTHTLGYTIQGNPEWAHTLAPGDGQITALLSQKRLTPNATPSERAEVVRLARLALRQDPTAVRAVTTLGLATQLGGNQVSARRLLSYAKTLSRRSLQTQLWAIEDAVGRNDIPDALKQYDIALRTSTTAPDLLFPVLAAASVDPVIRPPLIKVLAAKPPWGEGFVEFLAGNGPDARATSLLFQGLRQAGADVSDVAQAAEINALMGNRLPEDAWAYYASVRKDAHRLQSRDPRFSAHISTPSIFDWTLSDNAALNSTIQRGDKGSVVYFSAPTSVGGIVLQQTQMLLPGNYSLAGRSADIDLPDASRPYWTLICRGGAELGRVPLPNSSQTERFAGRFSVPVGCPIQILALVVRPTEALSGVSGQVQQVQLSPVR